MLGREEFVNPFEIDGKWYKAEDARTDNVVRCGDKFVRIYSAFGRIALGVEEVTSADHAIQASETTIINVLAGK